MDFVHRQCMDPNLDYCNDRFPPQSERFPNNWTWAQPRGWPLSHQCLAVQE